MIFDSIEIIPGAKIKDSDDYNKLMAKIQTTFGGKYDEKVIAKIENWVLDPRTKTYNSTIHSIIIHHTTGNLSEENLKKTLEISVKPEISDEDKKFIIDIVVPNLIKLIDSLPTAPQATDEQLSKLSELIEDLLKELSITPEESLKLLPTKRVNQHKIADYFNPTKSSILKQRGGFEPFLTGAIIGIVIMTVIISGLICEIYIKDCDSDYIIKGCDGQIAKICDGYKNIRNGIASSISSSISTIKSRISSSIPNNMGGKKSKRQNKSKKNQNKSKRRQRKSKRRR